MLNQDLLFCKILQNGIYIFIYEPTLCTCHVLPFVYLSFLSYIIYIYSWGIYFLHCWNILLGIFFSSFILALSFLVPSCNLCRGCCSKLGKMFSFLSHHRTVVLWHTPANQSWVQINTKSVYPLSSQAYVFLATS